MANMVDAIWAKAAVFATRWLGVVVLIAVILGRAAAASGRCRRSGRSTSAGRLPPMGQQLLDAAVQLRGQSGGTYSGGCSAPQTPTRPPCTARICEPVAAASAASYPLGTAAGTKLGAATLWSQAVTACCMYSKASRPWRRQVSITEKPRAMKRSPRRERVGPEILRLTTMARSARSASLLVGATSARRRNVHSEIQDLRSCAQGTYSRGSFRERYVYEVGLAGWAL